MMYVLVYDVVNDRRRDRLHRTLKNFGTAVQRSVFELDLEHREVEEMMRQVEKLVEPEEDTVRLYRLCAACLSEVRIVGEGELGIDPEYYIV